jgi:glycosyltransferase involved in cell wall biosynthesis
MIILQVLPSIMRLADGELQIDNDFCESLRVALESFDRVVVACPVAKEVLDSGLIRSTPLKDLPWRSRVRFIPLPNAYGLLEFIRYYGTTRKVLKEEIEKADCLVFSPHTLIGDWPTVAAREAIKSRRKYVIEADVVYESLARVNLNRSSAWKRYLKENVLLSLFEKSYRYCLENSRLALFQGQEVFDAYARFCINPVKVYHHIPVYKGSHITERELKAKIERVNNGTPLRICYAGRAVEMKGPMDWIYTINELIRCGVKVEATWLGDGSLLADMRTKIDKLGIGESVTLTGFVMDPNLVLQKMKDSDIFLYCHKTQESARCLGEALACGCPLIGYASAYPVELVGQHGGGQFAGLGDWGDLAEKIQYLDRNREKLSKLINDASVSGSIFDREARLRDRIDLIKSSSQSVAL